MGNYIQVRNFPEFVHALQYDTIPPFRNAAVLAAAYHPVKHTFEPNNTRKKTQKTKQK